MKSKQEIRRHIEAQRRALDPDWITTASTQIVRNVENLEEFKSAEIIALYMAIHGEVNIEALFATCWDSGKRTCIPVFNAEDKMYEMAEIKPATAFQTGHYGIREPIDPVLFPVQHIELMAVPGVAFDQKGQRLGRGGGYYDRLLNGFAGVSIAAAFDFQVLPVIPAMSHDQSVDLLVTETGAVRVFI